MAASPDSADPLELLRCLDALLEPHGLALLARDERGKLLHAGRALAAPVAFEPQAALALSSGARWELAVLARTPAADGDNVATYTAREDERRKLAVQMHDTLAQTLTSLSMHAEVLASVIQHGIEEARVMLHRLRPPELSHAGLEAALRTMLNDAPGVEGRVQSERNPSEDGLTEPQALALFRMVQGVLEPAAAAREPWRVEVALKRAGALELQLEVTVHGDGVALDRVRMSALKAPIEAVGGRLQLLNQAAGELALRAIVNTVPD